MGRRKLVKVCPIIQNTEINVVKNIIKKELLDKDESKNIAIGN